MIRSRLFWKLYLGYVVLIFLTTIVIGVLVNRRIEMDLLESDIMNVHMLAGPDINTGAPDDLPIPDDCFAGADRLDAHLVTHGNRGLADHIDTSHVCVLAFRQRHARDRDIVGCVEVNRRLFRGRRHRNVYKAHLF